MWELIMSVVNVPAMFAGVAATVAYMYATPGPVDAEGKRIFSTFPGSIWSRLSPFIGPTMAFAATIGTEWYTIHPELGGKPGILPADVVRGMTTALGSEYCFRIYYKTIRGI
jgi:hypothetical protein